MTNALRAEFEALGFTAAVSEQVQTAPRAISALLSGGRATLARGDWAAARLAFSEARRMAPQVPVVHLCLAELWLNRDRPDRLLAELEVAHKLGPSDRRVEAALRRAELRSWTIRADSEPLEQPVLHWDQARASGAQPSRREHEENTGRMTESQTRGLRDSAREFREVPDGSELSPIGLFTQRGTAADEQQPPESDNNACVSIPSPIALTPARPRSRTRNLGSLVVVAAAAAGCLVGVSWRLGPAAAWLTPVVDRPSTTKSLPAPSAGATAPLPTPSTNNEPGPIGTEPAYVEDPGRVTAYLQCGDGWSALAELGRWRPSADSRSAIALGLAALMTEDRHALEWARLTLGSATTAESSALEKKVQGEVMALRLRVLLRLGEDPERLFQLARDQLPAGVGSSNEGSGDLKAIMETAIAAHQPEAAATAAGLLLGETNQDLDAQYVLARWAASQRHFSEALRRLEDLLHRAPRHAASRLLLGRVLNDMGQVRAAAESYRTLAADLESNVRDGVSAGQQPSTCAVRQRHSLSSAATTAQLAGTVRGTASLSSTYLALAETLLEFDLLQAEEVLDRVQELRPTDPHVAVLRARLAVFHNQPEQALLHLTQVPAHDPEGLALRGDVFLLQDHFYEARTAFRRALALDDAHLPSLVGLGEAELGLGHPLSSRAALQKAYDMTRDTAGQPRLKARLLTALGASFLSSPDGTYVTAATSALQAASELETAPPDAHFWLGIALNQAHAVGQRAALLRYLELAPHGLHSERAVHLLAQIPESL